jgi:hypothetical protein
MIFVVSISKSADGASMPFTTGTLAVLYPR